MFCPYILSLFGNDIFKRGLFEYCHPKTSTPVSPYRSFHCHAEKEYIGNHPVEEAKKTKSYKRLIYKQFVQVSGPCGSQFLSYLPKRFTYLCRALYGDAILVYRFGAPIWPPEINQNIWSSLFVQKLFLSTRLARKHIF